MDRRPLLVAAPVAALLVLAVAGGQALALYPRLPFSGYAYQANAYRLIAYQNAIRLAAYQNALRAAAMQRAARLNAGMQPLYASAAQIARQHHRMIQQFLAAQRSGRIVAHGVPTIRDGTLIYPGERAEGPRGGGGPAGDGGDGGGD